MKGLKNDRVERLTYFERTNRAVEERGEPWQMERVQQGSWHVAGERVEEPGAEQAVDEEELYVLGESAGFEEQEHGRERNVESIERKITGQLQEGLWNVRMFGCVHLPGEALEGSREKRKQTG